LLLYSSKPSFGVFELAGHFTSSTRPHQGPLSSHGTGVYDGPQGTPRYFIVGGEYQGHSLLA
jgi:hypothetical protein